MTASSWSKASLFVGLISLTVLCFILFWGLILLMWWLDTLRMWGWVNRVDQIGVLWWLRLCSCIRPPLELVESLQSSFNPSHPISQPVCLLSLVNRSLARAHRDHASVCTRQGWMCRSLLCFALLWAGFFFLANRSLIHSLLIRLVERGGLVDWKCGRDWDRTLSV